MASYNKEKYIQESIESVLTQSLTNLELIIVDDHSNDSTVEIIRQFEKKDTRIVFIESVQNKGANYCRNIGIKRAKAKFVLFLDADDLLSKDCVQNRLNYAGKYPELNLMVFTMGVFYSKVGDDLRKWSPISKTPLKDFLQHKLPWSIMQPLWKKEFLLALGGFDESFNRLQDVELNTRALLHKDVNFQMISTLPDCYYRIDEERKNFNHYDFLKRWVDSAIQYCDKFMAIVKREEKPFLLGTIYQTELQIIYNYKNNFISKQELDELFKKLYSSSMISELSTLKKMILHLAKAYNLYFIRIPGLNKLFFYCLKM